MSLKKFHVLVFLICCTRFLTAQTVRGIIIDAENKPIFGVTVYWLGTNMKAISNTKGFFKIQKSETTNTLIFSSAEYRRDTIDVVSDSVQVQLKSRTLKSVEITSKKQTIENINAKFTEKIDLCELKKMACCNLAESFENSNTVDVVYGDGVVGSREIQMLGLDGAYTQMLFENTPYIRGIMQPFGLEHVPGTWIENISVNKGAGSVVNGFESMAGQINLEYKKPRKADKLFVNLFTTHFGKTDINIDASNKLSDRWATTVLAHTNFYQNKFDMNQDGFLDMPLSRSYNVMNRWQYSGDNFAAQFGTQFISERRKTGKYYHNTSSSNQTPYIIDLSTTASHSYAKTGFSFKGEEHSLGILYRYSYQLQEGSIGSRNYYTKEHFGNINAIYQNRIKEIHLLKLGASFWLDKQTETLDSITLYKNEKIPGIFTEYTLSPSKTWNMILGARYDYHNTFGSFFTPRMVVKFSPTSDISLRLSAGSGFRTASVLAENMGLLISSRNVVLVEKTKPEQSWNYGMSLNKTYGKNTFDFSYFYTNFKNQIVIDLETNNTLRFYNLHGRSFAHSIQADYAIKLPLKINVKASYKYDWVKTQYETGFKDKPFVKNQKALINADWTSTKEKWRISATGLFFGRSRVPNTALLGTDYSPTYFIAHTQGTFIPKKNLEIYTGVENLTNYRQKKLIIDAENPFGSSFDAAMIWGPVEGRRFYIGLRYFIK